MNATLRTALLTSLRHSLTALAGLGGFLASRGLVAADDAGAVDAAGGSLADALAAVGAALAARGLIWLFSKFPNARTAGATPLSVIAVLGTAGCFWFFIPSCSPSPTSAPVPFHGTVETEYGTIGYDSKGGLTIHADARPRRVSTVDTASGK